MPRPVCITYDSTCDLTPRLLERFHIRTVPLTVQSGERVFPDDGRYTSSDLYADYRRNGTLPKTTAVSPEAFKAFFAPILAEGFDIVHIDISSELSCTCQNAVLAAQELAEQGQVHVVDSRQLSTGGGLLALQGARLRDSGMAASDIAANNLMVLGTMRALQELGLRVPEDIALVAFDDFEWADLFQPRLTTIVQPCYDIGSKAVEMLIRRIHDPDATVQKTCFTPKLVVRESCGIKLKHGG